MTYNQEKYIQQCLQSIVDQVTDFDFEIIVADDCSTDRTQEIVHKFAKKYPKVIRAVLHDKNVGVGVNYSSSHDLAKGEYVAHCDGDDHWLPGKLQYQATLLDNNPQASQCWGCAHLIDDDGKKIGIFPSRLARLLNPIEITARHIALSYALVGQHSTQMYRRKFKFGFDVEKPVLDYWIAFNMALHGPAIYSKAIVGCYRITKTPSMTRSANKKRATVDFLAVHLSEIIEKYIQYRKEAKSNMVVRYYLSKIKRHNLDEIDRNLNRCANVSCRVRDLCSSLLYFLLQKVF